MATAQSQPKSSGVRFGAFEVDLCRRELFKHGIRIRLQKQPFEILCTLLEQPGEVVSREELQRRLWPENTFVEYGDSLNTAVRKLRAALNDSSDMPRYIATVARQGYRFIAPVEPIYAPRPGTKPGEDERTKKLLILKEAPASDQPAPLVQNRLLPALLVFFLISAGAAVGLWLNSRRASAARPPTASRADDLYQKGRLLWNKRSPAGFAEALRYFQQAIAIDPHHARAYAGIADTYALMSGYDLAPADVYMPKARAAALKAIELDPNLAEPHVSLAVIAQDYDWDWQTAEGEYRRAIALDPNYATAHHWYAECLALQGKFPQAQQEIERARQLDPTSLIIAADRGAILYFSRRYDAAIEQFRAVLKLEPYFPRAFMLNWAYLQRGQLKEAREQAETWRRISDQSWLWDVDALAAARAGDLAGAQRAVEQVKLLARKSQSDPLPVVVAFMAVGDKDEAFHYLDLAFGRHSASLTSLKVDPTYDPLRTDPRFKRYLRRLNFEP